jgi:hypothetical protein
MSTSCKGQPVGNLPLPPHTPHTLTNLSKRASRVRGRGGDRAASSPVRARVRAPHCSGVWCCLAAAAVFGIVLATLAVDIIVTGLDNHE